MLLGQRCQVAEPSALFAAVPRLTNRGTVRFFGQGRKRGVFRHESRELYDASKGLTASPGSFPGAEDCRPEEIPGQSFASILKDGQDRRKLFRPEEPCRTEPGFDSRIRAKTCDDQIVGLQCGQRGRNLRNQASFASSAFVIERGAEYRCAPRAFSLRLVGKPADCGPAIRPWILPL